MSEITRSELRVSNLSATRLLYLCCERSRLGAWLQSRGGLLAVSSSKGDVAGEISQIDRDRIWGSSTVLSYFLKILIKFFGKCWVNVGGTKCSLSDKKNPVYKITAWPYCLLYLANMSTLKERRTWVKPVLNAKVLHNTQDYHQTCHLSGAAGQHKFLYRLLSQ